MAICCTLNNVPMTASALERSRLPFAIHVYPFGQDENVPVSSEGIIVRCGICRAYINPYVRINEQRNWQCNLCNRINETPPEFIYDYNNRQYYDLGSKMELTSETVEYIASVEYMVRPPQPACYMFVFDCSKQALELGYIPILASTIAILLDDIPGDARASIGFLAFDSNIHYFSFSGTQVVHYVNPDVSTTLMPCSSDGILANIVSKREIILDFLNQILPNFPSPPGGDHSSTTSTTTNTTSTTSTTTTDNRSALGPAIKIASKIMAPIGGKIIVIQAQLPNYGAENDGSVLQRREDPSLMKNMATQKGTEYLTPLINPATDFYKNLSLECNEHQVSVDLFNLSTSYADLASISQLCKFSAGNIYHYSNSYSERKSTLIRFEQDLRNYLVRPLGLESVLRLRYSRGLKIHTFHGNFFVRSSNLLALPIANPDTGYALQISLEDDLKPNTRFVYFQASVLYTTPEGERRIRVHTARYPTATTLPEIIYGANQTAIVGMLAKMAVDRSLQMSIGEAKEALIGAGVDLLEIYSIADEMRARSYAMSLPENLRLVPLFILALLKHTAFKLPLSNPIKLDDRVAAMEYFKTLPIDDLMTYIYPDLYPLHTIATDQNEDWKNPMSLSAAHLERNGAYLLDAYNVMIIYICQYIDPRWCYDTFGVQEYDSIPERQDVFAPDQSNQAIRQNVRPRDPANFTATAIPTGYPSASLGQKQLQVDRLPTAEEVAEAPIVDLPELQNITSMKLRDFISFLIENRPQKPKFYIIKDNSRARTLFTQYLIDDRSESYHSYAEFYKFLQDQSRK